MKFMLALEKKQAHLIDSRHFELNNIYKKKGVEKYYLMTSFHLF